MFDDEFISPAMPRPIESDINIALRFGTHAGLFGFLLLFNGGGGVTLVLVIWISIFSSTGVLDNFWLLFFLVL